MGTSCTKAQNKKKRSAPVDQPLPPPIFISEEAGLSPYNPKPVQEIDQDEVVIRILTPQPSPIPSSPASEIIVADERSAGSLEGEANDPGQTDEVIDVSQQGPPQASGPDDEVISVRSSQRSSLRSSRTPERRSFFSFLSRDKSDTRAETKGAKSAAHPSRNKTIEDFSKPLREDKDFPTDQLDKIREVIRDRLPLDILTRRTKVLNNLRTKMSSLEKLELRHCKLNTFPPEFKSTSIKELNFSDNLISDLPPAVFPKLLSLELLNISQNLLKSLPDTLTECTNLKELLVDRNQIKEVTPEMLVGLTNLRILNLMHNKMERMTFTLNVIPTVKELNCSKNLIGVVTDDFFDFVECKLEVFKLSHNPLKDIGIRVLDLINLRRLDLRQTHIGSENPTFMAITERNESDGGPMIKCLVHQLIAFEETSTLQPVVEEKLLSPVSPAEVPEERKEIADVEKHLDEDLIAAQTLVPIEEVLYDYPPETSILHVPLKDLVLQVNDNLHITLTVATIEKIVRQGLDAKNKGVLVLNLPLTSNYFMERIARYPSAINVLSSFKYQIRDDPHRGLILQPSADFNSTRKRDTSEVGKKPPIYQKAERSESKSDEQKPKLKDDSVEELLAALIKFKQSVGRLVEKEFDVPDFNAYVK
jgi:hypothetical protein